MKTMKTHEDRMLDLCAGRSIAIIGNSENVIDYKIGEIIDSFDIVVRMNKFNTKDYSDYIGTKTNIYVTCFWDKVLHEPKMLEANEIHSIFCSIPCEPCTYFPNYKEYKRNMNKAYDIGWRPYLRNTIVYPSPEYFDEIGGYIGKRPSSGVIALCWFLDHIPFDHLYATGLSFGSNKNHYNQEDYGKVGPGYKHHNPSAEKFAVYKVLNRCDKDVLLDPHMSKIISGVTNEDFHKYQRKIRESAK